MKIKELQQKEIEILKEIDRVCSKLGIKYTLSSGSALGAVRHKGFIPWDDDIDIAMTRDNYNKFLKQAQQHLANKYFIQTYETDPLYPHILAKVRDSSTTMIEGATAGLDINHGVYVDIFPLDVVSNKGYIRKTDNYILSLINGIKFSSTIRYCKNAKTKKNRCVRLLIYPLAKLIGTQRLCRLEDHIRTRYDKKKNCKLTYGDSGQVNPPHRLRDDRLMDITIFNNMNEVEFEKEKFCLIEEYDTYLSTTYGNYMELPPVEKRIAHHDIVQLDLEQSYVNYRR